MNLCSDGRHAENGARMILVRAQAQCQITASSGCSTPASVAPQEESRGSSPSTAAPEKTSFQDGIAASFTKTFIRESRWKLFAEGFLTTLLITVLAALSGTVLGFLTFMMCRNGNPAANTVTRFITWLV